MKKKNASDIILTGTINKKQVMDTILPVLLVLVAVFLIINVVLLQARTANWQTAQEDLKEQLRPAGLQLTIVTADKCSECANLEGAITQLKSLNVNITEENTVDGSSAYGKELISKYSIEKLPSFIASGEINKSSKLADYFSSNGEIINGQFVYTAGKAPYYSLAGQRAVGLVSITYISDSACPSCVDLSSIPQVLEEKGVHINEYNEIDYQKIEGKELSNNYGVERVPALLISSEIDAYPEIAQDLITAGAPQSDGSYIFQAPSPVYRDVATNEIIGLVNLVMLTDNSCSECYNVAVNKQILQRFGLVINSENTYDIKSEQGEALREKYKVDKVPIIILSPGASVYPSLVQVWASVGSVEEDGWFVMRKPEQMGAYKDLNTNEIINPKEN